MADPVATAEVPHHTFKDCMKVAMHATVAAGKEMRAAYDAAKNGSAVISGLQATNWSPLTLRNNIGEIYFSACSAGKLGELPALPPIHDPEKVLEIK